MTDKEKKNDYFTEEDQRKLLLLPEEEQREFYLRFAEISMAMRIADDAWNQARDDLTDKGDQLIRDVHERLDKIDTSGTLFPAGSDSQ